MREIFSLSILTEEARKGNPLADRSGILLPVRENFPQQAQIEEAQ